MVEKNEVVISEEIAEEEFKKWADDNEIDIDTQKMSSEEKDSFDLMKGRIIKAISKGLLVIDDNGNFAYTISGKSQPGYAGSKLTISQPTGQAFIATDNFKQGQNVHKSMAILSALTGKDVKFFTNLHVKDYKVLDAIATFMLAD